MKTCGFLTQFNVQLIDHIVGIPEGQLIAIIAAHIWIIFR